MHHIVYERIDVKNHLLEALQGAAKKRNRLGKLKTIDGETEFEWVFHERTVMTAEVNSKRHQRGLPPITMKDIARLERLAVGHSDYMPKFALYCAELALGIDPLS